MRCGMPAVIRKKLLESFTKFIACYIIDQKGLDLHWEYFVSSRRRGGMTALYLEGYRILSKPERLGGTIDVRRSVVQYPQQEKIVYFIQSMKQLQVINIVVACLRMAIWPFGTCAPQANRRQTSYQLVSDGDPTYRILSSAVLYMRINIYAHTHIHIYLHVRTQARRYHVVLPAKRGGRAIKFVRPLDPSTRYQ